MATMAPIGHEPLPILEEAPSLPVYRFRVDQYLAMIESGVLSSDDRVELLEGWIVPKMTKNPPHVVTTRNLFEALSRIVPDGWLISKEDPIVLDRSMPEPDLALIRGRSEDFKTQHPTAQQVALIIEVAESSHLRDRGEKLRAYAAARIPLYWLVDLVESVVEVYSEPMIQGGRATYGNVQVHGKGARLPLILDAQTVGSIEVCDVLP